MLRQVSTPRLTHEKDQSGGHYRTIIVELDKLQSIFDSGADVFRLNYSHGERRIKQICIKKYDPWLVVKLPAY